MDQPAPSPARTISPYRVFSRAEWADLRADTPMTLTLDDLDRLKGLNDPISLIEVAEIYLPLSRLLSLYVAATQGLHEATRTFLGTRDGITPYIIGLAGSVAVGKSTTGRVLRALLRRWPNTPRVELIATDGFLLPNAVLAREGLMERKGFPESYDLPALLAFLNDIKSGRPTVSAPVYSHLSYDIVPGERVTIARPDILIVEGLNVLQTSRPPRDGRAVPFVSDFFDFSIYIDAEEPDIRRWYVSRFQRLRETAFRDPQSFFHRYATISAAEATQIAAGLWERINLVNLRENILPTRLRADLILKKDESHAIMEVALRANLTESLDFRGLIFRRTDLISTGNDPPKRRLTRMMADENSSPPNGNGVAEPGSAKNGADAPAVAAPPQPSAAEFAELRDKLLRALADAENARRRTERDVADARQYAVTSFAREILQVGDNLRRALAAVPADKRKGADPTLSALLEGVEVTERGLEQTLGKFGVKRIEAKGKKFDPSFHQAMFELPRDDVPAGTVVDEMQAGYVIGDRVLKPALVVIAKRPPAPANDDAPGAGEPAAAERSGSLGDDG